MKLLFLLSFSSFVSLAQNLPLKDFNRRSLQERGYVRCYSSEYNEQLRQQSRSRLSEAERERIIEGWVEKYKREHSNQRRSSVFYVPVVVHVIHNGEPVGTGTNISAAQVQSQIDVLNEDFRKKLGSRGYNTHPAGADTEIEFVLAKRRNDGSAFAAGEEGINRVNGSTAGFTAPPYNMTDIDGTIKPATIWDPTQYYNMWVLDLDGGLLGYAQFPEDSGIILGTGGECASTANTDGLVMGYFCFGSSDKGTFPALSAPYDLGRTTTHEIGHSFGLRHIWGDGGCGVDDYCQDTPTAGASNFTCAVVNSCTDTPTDANDMVENYMDYTDDACMNIFTYDQKIRMLAVLENSPRRREWTVSPALIPPTSDLGSLVNIISPTAEICTSAPSPVITVKNMGTNTLTSMVISYQVDGGATQNYNWVGSIASNGTLNITMPAITVAAGDHTYRAFVASSNGVANISTPGQNDLTFSFTYTINGAAIPYIESFDGNTFPPKNWQINQVGGQDCATWTQRTNITGADASFTSAAFMNHYSYDPGSNQQDELISPIIDISTATGTTQLLFDVAYRRYDNTTNERLQVFISTDCGATWVATAIYDKSGATLATLANSTADFAPTASGNWRNETIDISTYAGQKVKFKFVSTNQFGNGLYVDNIRVIDSNPIVSFVAAATSHTENSTSGTEDCRGYQDINIALAISLAPSSDVTVDFTLSGTAANNADYKLNSSTVTFPAGSAANQNLSVRVYNDQAIESLETAIITLGTITNGISDPTKETHTISITDNDIAPSVANAGGTLLSENFEGAVTGWSQYTSTGAANIWRIGTQRVLNGTYSAYISQSAVSGNYNNTAGAALLQTPVIDASAYPTNDLQVSFNFQCNGERTLGTDYDYGSLYYALAATPTTWVLIEGADPSP
ncbi:MAG: choice-of-anchor J domain-containing protein, partial [Thermonemataceae bacterium]|nr:choice-of-anchor J domain-containing protein [Thermonemataceae bacterium]